MAFYHPVYKYILYNVSLLLHICDVDLFLIWDGPAIFEILYSISDIENVFLASSSLLWVEAHVLDMLVSWCRGYSPLLSVVLNEA